MAAKWLGTRIFSTAALCATVAGVGYIGNTGYRCATDAWVVPVALGPDSDLVISSKLSRAQLVNERMKTISKRDEVEADLGAAEASIEELKVLQASVAKSLEWTTALNTHQASSGKSSSKAIDVQESEINTMIAEQEKLVDQTKKELEAGLVSKTDYSREVQTLSQLRVTRIENQRARIVNDKELTEVQMSQQSMRSGGAATPEMVQQQGQLVKIKCDMIKLEAERRAKTAERSHLEEELAKIDELVTQLNQRPIFRAIDGNTNVVFIPYSQIDDVTNGQALYECTIGLFACNQVGRMTELLPGEVAVPDPWGSLSRGRYGVIELTDPHAAQSKTLRIRPGTGGAPHAVTESTRVASSK